MNISGENIVCFAKDWEEDPTSNNHVMIELARNNRVLWLNSIATRRPKLTSGRDVKKMFRKLVRAARGAKQVLPNLWVYTPIVIPLPHSRWAGAVNGLIMRMTVSLLRWKLKMREFQLWAFLPSAAQYVGRLGESLSVYYCTDDYAKFSYVDNQRTQDAEDDLVRKADLVFATAQLLVDRRRQLNPQTYLARHGVDHEMFAAPLKQETAVPEDLRQISQPIIGFYGTIQDWIDVDLIEYLASRHPEWSIVLIGSVFIDVSRLKRYANVHLMGRRPHSELPNYCKGFSVGIIPYVLNERIMHVNPIKLREYLSAGLPVVSSAMPEVVQYSHLCHVAANHAEFEAGIVRALETNSCEEREARSAAMAGESWAQRVMDLMAHVTRVKNSKSYLKPSDANVPSSKASGAECLGSAFR